MTSPKDAGWLTHNSSLSEDVLEHPGIVMRVLCSDEGHERVMVLHGTSTPRSRDGRPLRDDEVPSRPTSTCFFIEPTHPDAIRMGLTRRTYFSTAGLWFGHPKHLRVVATVSDALFFELRVVVGLARPT